MKKQKKKLVNKISNTKKRNSINAVDGWNEFLKDLKQLEVKQQQEDLKFKSSIDPVKRDAAIDKLNRVVRNKVIDLFNDAEKEFSEDEINLIEQRIEIPDSIGTYSREVFREHIDNILQLIFSDREMMNRHYVKVQGENRIKGAMKKKDFIPDEIKKPLFDLMESGLSLGSSLKKLDLNIIQIKNYQNTIPIMARKRIDYAKNNPSPKNEPAYKTAIKVLELYEKNKGNRKPTK